MSYQIKVTFPNDYRAPKMADGSPNPFWDLIVQASVFGYKLKTSEQTEIDMTGINALEMFPLATALSILAISGTKVTVYPCFIELASNPATTQHPTATDPETGNSLTWDEWLTGSQNWIELGGKWYAQPQPNGKLVPLSEIKAYIDSGISVIEVADFKAIQQAIPTE